MSMARHTIRHRVALAALTVFVLASTACGTTVPGAEVQLSGGVPATDPATGEVLVDPLTGQPANDAAVAAGDGLGGDGLGGDGLGGAAVGGGGGSVGGGGGATGSAAPAASSGSGGAAKGASGARAGGGSGGSGSGGAKTGGSAASGGPVGPGVTDKEIAIGISLFDAGDMSDKIGTEAAYGNTKKQAQAVVDYVNANGGIAGRKVRPVYYNVDFGRNPGTFKDGQFEQEACAAWTEDDKVFAAINNTMARQNLLVCLAQRGVPAVHDAMPVDQATMDKYREFYYNLAAPVLERRARFSINAQGKAGAFKGAVVGIMYYNDPSYKRIIDTIYIPMLKKYGAKDVFLQAAPRGGAQEAPAAVSHFRRNGVTHVTFFGEAGAYPLFFMPAAENQLYRPKYFFNSDHQLLILQDTAPKEQLRNVTGQGWMPVLDTVNANDPGPVSASNKLCLEIQRKAGQDMSVRGARYTAQGYCGGLFFFKQTLDRAASVHSSSLAQVVAGLGPNFISPAVFATNLNSSQHDAPVAYRDFAYRDNGFYYTSPVRKMQ